MSIIEVITPLFNSARSQTIEMQSLPNAYGHFITIDSNNRVGEHSLIAATAFDGNCWTICTLRKVYFSYGWYTTYEVFAIVNREAKVVREIVLNNWLIKDIRFIAVKDSSKPIPVAALTFKEDKSQSSEFEFYGFENIQNVWDFVLEIDQKCNTIAEVKLYKEYFEMRLHNQTISASLEEYKKELAKKESIINQYQTLIDRIQSLVRDLPVQKEGAKASP